MTKRAAIPILAVLVTWASHSVLAPAGNPLQTNDPETPGPNGWEINVSQNLRLARPAFSQALPLVNINYGWLENDQWKISVPVLEIDPHPGAAEWGIGDVQLGWKYRFLEEDEHGVQAAVYPQPLLPTGREDLGLGNGRVELFLPVSVGKYFFDDCLFLYAEAGHNVVFEDLHRDAWFLGAAAEWQVTEKIELVGELADLVVPQFVGSDDLFFNLGFNYQFARHVALQTAFGRSLGDAADGLPYVNSYIGLHITWGGGESEEGGDADECCDRRLSRWTRALLVR